MAFLDFLTRLNPLSLMKTPGINPAAAGPKAPAPALPSPAAPRLSPPAPSLPRGPLPMEPGGDMGKAPASFDLMKRTAMEGNAPVSPEYFNDMRSQYVAERGQKRTLKDTLLNALSGAGQGFAATGDLGGAIGGAVTGAGGTLISPRAGAQFGFNTREAPQILEQRGLQVEEQGRLARMGQIAQDIATKRAQQQRAEVEADRAGQDQFGYGANVGVFNRRTGQVAVPAVPKPQAQQRPVRVAPGDRLVDPVTGMEIFAAPDRPQRPQRDPNAPTPGQQGSFERRDRAEASRLINQINTLMGPVTDKNGNPKTESAQEFKLRRRQIQQVVERLRRDYPQYAEVGDFDIDDPDSWPYAKERRAAPQASSSGGGQFTVDPGFIDFVAAQKGISREEAERMVRQKYAVK